MLTPRFSYRLLIVFSLLAALLTSVTAASAAPSADVPPSFSWYTSSPWNVGKQLIDTTSDVHRVWVYNQSANGVLHITSMTASSDFEIVSTTCDTVASNGSCYVDFTFTPTAIGERDGALTSVDDAPGSPHVLNLIGTGSDHVMTLSATLHDFGRQQINSNEYPGFPVTVTNIGPDPLNLGATHPQGYFSLGQGTCYLTNPPWVLAPGASCMFVPYFSPQIASDTPVTGAIILPDVLPGETHIVTLIGTGVEGIVSFSDSSHDFGEQLDVTYSEPFVETVTNTGNGDLTITEIEGATGFWIQNDNCTNNPIPPGGACTFGIAFRPIEPGSYSAEIHVWPPYSLVKTVVVTGVGIEPVVELGSEDYDMGEAQVGTEGETASETVTNTGTADLHVAAVASSGDFTVKDNTCATVKPGKVCTFAITFAPSAVGDRKGAVIITDDTQKKQHKVTLKGKGVKQPARTKITTPAKTLLTTVPAVEFDWPSATYAATYRIQISTSSKFSTTVIDQGDIAGLSYTATLPDNGVYYARVQAVNASHVAGKWSGLRKVTLDRTPPPVPLFKSTVATSSRPTLSVFKSDGAVLYEFEVWSDTASLFSAKVKKTSYKVTSDHMLTTGSYHWRVRAYDKAGNPSDWSELFDLQVP